MRERIEFAESAADRHTADYAQEAHYTTHSAAVHHARELSTHSLSAGPRNFRGARKRTNPHLL